MKSDLGSVIDSVTTFLGQDKVMTSDKREALRSHLHIDNFRKNKSVNMESSYANGESNGSFIRKGAVGGWRSFFTEERVEDWKMWVEENTKGTGIDFKLD